MIINLSNQEREMLEEYEEMINNPHKDYSDNEPLYYLQRFMTNFVNENMKDTVIYIGLKIENAAKANLFIDTIFNMRLSKDDIYANSLVENTGCTFIEYNINSQLSHENVVFNEIIKILERNGYIVKRPNEE